VAVAVTKIARNKNQSIDFIEFLASMQQSCNKTRKKAFTAR